MSITKDNKIVWGMILGAILFMGLAYLGVVNYQKAYGNSISNAAIDLVGSRVGTTTTGVSFAPFSASTTYRTLLNGDIDTAIITLKATNASTTNGVLNMHILGSNDSTCTATSTLAGVQINQVVQQDINWFDLAPHIKDLAGSTAITNATTTIQWLTSRGLGKEIVLTDLNLTCIALEIRGASTTLHSQIRTKQK